MPQENKYLSYINPQNSQIENLINKQLDQSKAKDASTFWGRKAIFALDMDSAEDIVRIYIKEKDHFKSDVFEQVTPYGYAGYLWTIRIHKYLGDTILHLALRMKKLECVYALLLHNISPDTYEVRNILDESCNDVCKAIYNTTLEDMKRIAFEEIINSVDPRRFEYILPMKSKYQSSQREARYLLHNGRFLGDVTPHTLKYRDLTKAEKSLCRSMLCNEIVTDKIDGSANEQSNSVENITSTNKNRAVNKYNFKGKPISQYIRPYTRTLPKPVWRRRYEYDPKTGTDIIYLLQTITGERKSMTAGEIRYGYWDLVTHEDGKIYRINEV